MITGIEHPAVSVADLERSLAFYRDLLGLNVVRLLEPRRDAKLGVVAGMPGARARIAHLRLGEGMLELFQYVEPVGRPIPRDRRQADHGLIHIGLRSSDARADCARLRAAGVEFFSEPVEFRPGVWVAYFRGPDGEVCELREDPEALPAAEPAG